jgi:hypothetical protein
VLRCWGRLTSLLFCSHLLSPLLFHSILFPVWNRYNSFTRFLGPAAFHLSGGNTCIIYPDHITAAQYSVSRMHGVDSGKGCAAQSRDAAAFRRPCSERMGMGVRARARRTSRRGAIKRVVPSIPSDPRLLAPSQAQDGAAPHVSLTPLSPYSGSALWPT